jgi:hypothetical protein
MANEIEDTFDKLKSGAKAVAKKVTDPSKDLSDEYDKERGKDNPTISEQTRSSGTRDPISSEKIGSNEPTAVRRDSSLKTGAEPLKNLGENNEQFATGDSSKSDESTPGVSATFSCEECGQTFGSRQELKDHGQQH